MSDLSIHRPELSQEELEIPRGLCCTFSVANSGRGLSKSFFLFFLLHNLDNDMVKRSFEIKTPLMNVKLSLFCHKLF